MKSHLSKEQQHEGAGYDELQSREYWCRDCGIRVTVSPSGDKEYGHAGDCEHNPRSGEVPTP